MCTALNYSQPGLIASCTILGCSDFVHLRDPFLEFLVLAFLVTMSFVLAFFQSSALQRMFVCSTYHTLPWEIEFVVTALIEGNE